MVWPTDADASTSRSNTMHGIPTISEHVYSNSLPSNSNWQANRLPFIGIQRIIERLLRGLRADSRNQNRIADLRSESAAEDDGALSRVELLLLFEKCELSRGFRGEMNVS